MIRYGDLTLCHDCEEMWIPIDREYCDQCEEYNPQ